MSTIKDGIYISYPQDKINISGIKTDLVGGHGMVIAVDENTGKTRGSEYGRNYNNSGKFGAARRVIVPNFYPANPGNPTTEELDQYAKKLQRDSHGNTVHVTYIKGADYDKMVDYMKEAESGKGFASKPYNLANHNCGSYGVQTINQAMPWYRKITGGLFNAIPNIINTPAAVLMGVGHDIEQKTLGTHTKSALTDNSSTFGRADMHGYSLPWFTIKGTYTRH